MNFKRSAHSTENSRSFTLNIPDISFLNGEDGAALVRAELAPVRHANRGVSPVLRGRAGVHGVKSKTDLCQTVQKYILRRFFF